MKTKGRLSLNRFKVMGDLVAQNVLSGLSTHAFQESTIISTDEKPTVGFIGGDHMMDVEFTPEKNIFGDMYVFGIRMDHSKLPPLLRKAYREIEEKAAGAENPSGFASRVQKREAADHAIAKGAQEIAEGKHRKSKVHCLMLDLAEKVLYVDTAGVATIKAISELFQAAFNVDIIPLTPSLIADGVIMDSSAGSAILDSLNPSAFTLPPSEDCTVPSVEWSDGTRDWLGNEFALWLWYMNEECSARIESETGSIYFVLNKLLDTSCSWGILGKQSLKESHVTGLSEAGQGLLCGKWPRKFGMILSADEMQFEFTMQFDKWALTSVQLPKTDEATSTHEVMEQRCQLTRKAAQLMDEMFRTFMKLRISPAWTQVHADICAWILSRDTSPTIVADESDDE